MLESPGWRSLPGRRFGFVTLLMLHGEVQVGRAKRVVKIGYVARTRLRKRMSHERRRRDVLGGKVTCLSSFERELASPRNLG